MRGVDGMRDESWRIHASRCHMMLLRRENCAWGCTVCWRRYARGRVHRPCASSELSPILFGEEERRWTCKATCSNAVLAHKPLRWLHPFVCYLQIGITSLEPPMESPLAMSERSTVRPNVERGYWLVAALDITQLVSWYLGKSRLSMHAALPRAVQEWPSFLTSPDTLELQVAQ